MRPMQISDAQYRCCKTESRLEAFCLPDLKPFAAPLRLKS
jgi:hypothetical protein